MSESRVEDILTATINDTEVTDPSIPQSRVEALLMDLKDSGDKFAVSNQGSQNAGKIWAVGNNGDLTLIPAGTAGVTTAGDVSYINGTGYTSGSVGAAMETAEGDITQLKSDLTHINTALDAEYPNLWDCSYADDTANGITITKNANGTYRIHGTATALFYKQQIITLPAGTYCVNGFTGGATGTYHIMITGTGSTYYQTNGWTNGFTVNAETNIALTMRVMDGTTLDVTFAPMVANAMYRGIDYIQYGSPFFAKTVDEKIDAVESLTGYVKPNLFNNTIQSQTANNVTFTVNADKSVTVVTSGATALSAPNAKCTLQKGKYIVNGCNSGSSQTYHIMVTRGDDSYFYQYGGNDVGFEVTDNTEIVTLYIRITKNAVVDTTFYPMIRPASVYNPTYAPYGEYQIYKPIQQLIDYTQFNWSGKKMNVIGDSIVQGSYGNFIIPIRDILCLSEARNYGVGGSCLASSDADAQYPPAVLRYTSMDTDAQIIIVHAGTNDYSAQIPLGADDSTDITTFNGALNVMMNGLREMYPTALIIFDSILHRFNDGALTIKASQYRQCIEDRCLANHIVFYDCFKYSGFDFVKGYYDHILTSDGLHPNQTGANILGRKLAGFIRWN